MECLSRSQLVYRMTVHTLRFHLRNWCWSTLLHTSLSYLSTYLSIYLPSVQSNQHEVCLTYSSRSRVYSRATEWGDNNENWHN